MNKRLFTLQDIKDFLMQEYELDWRNFEVLQNGHRYSLRELDVKKQELVIQVFVYRNSKLEINRLYVSNKSFTMFGNNTQAKLRKWRNLMRSKLEQEHTLTR